MPLFGGSGKAGPSTGETEAFEPRTATSRTIARMRRSCPATDWASSGESSAPACWRASARNSSTSRLFKRNPEETSREILAMPSAWLQFVPRRRGADARGLGSVCGDFPDWELSAYRRTSKADGSGERPGRGRRAAIRRGRSSRSATTWTSEPSATPARRLARKRKSAGSVSMGVKVARAASPATLPAA